jgi:hypothetical protein
LITHPTAVGIDRNNAANWPKGRGGGGACPGRCLRGAAKGRCGSLLAAYQLPVHLGGLPIPPMKAFLALFVLCLAPTGAVRAVDPPISPSEAKIIVIADEAKRSMAYFEASHWAALAGKPEMSESLLKSGYEMGKRILPAIRVTVKNETDGAALVKYTPKEYIFAATPPLLSDDFALGKVYQQVVTSCNADLAKNGPFDTFEKLTQFAQGRVARAKAKAEKE